MLLSKRLPRLTRLGVVLAMLSPAMADLNETARATDGPDVKVTVEVEQEMVREGTDGTPTVERQPVGLAAPGDILVYTVRAENLGESPAFDPRLQDPIPEGTVLLPESVTRINVTASLDGGATWEAFPVRVLVGEDDSGEPLYEQAPPETYTHLRWQLDGPLGPGESKEVSFKVRVR
jgi:uncharacterized repeat protein (TIGR01451 family)